MRKKIQQEDDEQNVEDNTNESFRMLLQRFDDLITLLTPQPPETPPVETPPVETPPVETPPVETPPALEQKVRWWNKRLRLPWD